MPEIRSEAWFTEDSLIELESYLKYNNNLKIFEFGMGASTLWLSKFPSVTTLISVEHDKGWFDDIYKLITPHDNINVSLNFLERPYNKYIESYDDNYFDCVIVDGRDRVKCLESAKPKIKSLLILDNSERIEYASGIELYSGWERKDYTQPLPDKYNFTYPDWTTSFFRKK